MIYTSYIYIYIYIYLFDLDIIYRYLPPVFFIQRLAIPGDSHPGFGDPQAAGRWRRVHSVGDGLRQDPGGPVVQKVFKGKDWEKLSFYFSVSILYWFDLVWFQPLGLPSTSCAIRCGTHLWHWGILPGYHMPSHPIATPKASPFWSGRDGGWGLGWRGFGAGKGSHLWGRRRWAHELCAGEPIFTPRLKFLSLQQHFEAAEINPSWGVTESSRLLGTMDDPQLSIGLNSHSTEVDRKDTKLLSRPEKYATPTGKRLRKGDEFMSRWEQLQQCVLIYDI